MTSETEYTVRTGGVVVWVVPAPEHTAHARLFDAIERLYPAVRFEGRPESDLRGVAGVLAVGADLCSAPEQLPAVPLLLARGVERTRARPRTIRLASSGHLKRVLRGAVLRDDYVDELTQSGGDRAAILASSGERPVWTRAERGRIRVDTV